jgi:hypothetical protein
MEIREMTVAETELALDWAAGEGWNPGRHDTASFRAPDPAGLLVGLVGGEPGALIGCVRFGDAFGFVGLYLVRPDLRGRGHGLALWEAGHEHLGARASALEAVAAQVPNYARSGYVQGEAWTVRWRGEGRPAPADPLVGPVTAAEVAALDTRAFGVPRTAFVEAWLAQPEAVALGLRDAGGALRGYGVRRRCRVGWKVGPLFAPDLDGAGRLLDALVADVEGPYWIDVPADHPHATRLAHDRAMRSDFRTARMVRGTAPERDTALIYAITSLELG